MRDLAESFFLPEKLHFTFDSPGKLALLSLLKEVAPSSDHKMIKLVTFDILFRRYDNLAKTRSEMTTAIVFSRQNDAGSRASAHYLVLRKFRTGRRSQGLYNKNKRNKRIRVCYFLWGKRGTKHVCIKCRLGLRKKRNKHNL